MSDKYQSSGVSLENGYESVRRIKKITKGTHNIGVMGGIGSFGGMFDLSKYNINEPVLVSGTDGVGTKLLIAQECDDHSTIGIDLVAMCVNDVITCGAQPLFFLDYIATGKVVPNIIEKIVEGISKGCIDSGCALIGGETAEMPGMYEGNHYDLAGFTTGVVEKSKIIDIDNVKIGNKIIGLESSGIHSNGYSLVRKILFEDHHLKLDDYIDTLGCTLKEELLKPTTIYVKGILELINNCTVNSIAHITGGGFIENIPRAIPEGFGVSIDTSKIIEKPIFDLLMRLGEIPTLEMYNIFNMGIGMIVIVEENNVDNAINILDKFNYNPRVIGEVVSQSGVEILL
ncbi:MAG: phosphoribosylformylglycinamidine cyclo-ligase [Firmicutes bacterium]|nr:phosphoribosylformylglycinamidine cyclo-ligase [Bacillota bacterium]